MNTEKQQEFDNTWMKLQIFSCCVQHSPVPKQKNFSDSEES
jgi:hypothetical protein